MKITDVATIRLRAAIPKEQQVESRSGLRTLRSTTLVRIETDEGITGLGSCSGNGELVEVIIRRILRPLLLGADPTKIEEMWERAYVRGGHKEFGTRGIGIVALSGVDVALWDILGKVHGIPIYGLLGGKCREKVPVYATALYPEDSSVVARKAAAFVEGGFHGVKIKVGFNLRQDIEIIRAVRREIGKNFPVMADANQGYTLKVAREAAEAFTGEGVLWLEEPLFVEDIAGHAVLREESKIPIAIGENLHTHYAFDDFIRGQAVDIMQPDVARAGGISEIVKIAAMAAKHNLALSFHTWGDAIGLAASLHLAAALEVSTVMELDTTFNPLRESILHSPLLVHNGFMAPPDKPGLGVELDRHALDQFVFSGPEQTALRRDALH